MARTALFDSAQSVRNFVINGNFDFWQRGTTAATPATGTYLADRFRTDYDGTGSTFTVSQQAFTPGAEVVTGSPTYFLRHAVTVAGTGGTTRTIQQRIEGVRTLAGKTATLSFWAKADAARTVTASLTQNFGTGGSQSASVTGTGSMALSLTTSWQKFTVVAAVPSITGKTLGSNGNDFLAIVLALPVNTVMTIDVAQVMLNEGHEAATFLRAGRDLEAELALCQRFYEVVGELTGSTDFGMGRWSNTAGYRMLGGQFAVTKRAVPAATLYYENNGGGILTLALTSVTTSSAFADIGTLVAYSDMHGITADAEL